MAEPVSTYLPVFFCSAGSPCQKVWEVLFPSVTSWWRSPNPHHCPEPKSLISWRGDAGEAGLVPYGEQARNINLFFPQLSWGTWGPWWFKMDKLGALTRTRGISGIPCYVFHLVWISGIQCHVFPSMGISVCYVFHWDTENIFRTPTPLPLAFRLCGLTEIAGREVRRKEGRLQCL